MAGKAKESRRTKKRKTLWNLWEDGITQSALGLFLTCREQFRLTYMEGWEPQMSSAALAFGIAFHDCLAQIMRKKKPTIQKVLDTHAHKQNLGDMTSAERETFDLILGQVGIVLEKYLDFWEPQDSAREWLVNEEVFAVRHSPSGIFRPGPKPEPYHVTLVGRWDGVFRDCDNYLRLLETKTKSRIDEEGIQGSLQFDFQTMFYCLGIKLAYAKVPSGILYDVVRNPQLRQRKAETVTDFLLRIAQDIDERPAWYFKRWDVDITEDDLTLWIGRVLDPALRELIEWYTYFDEPHTYAGENPWRNPRHYMNPNALISGWGRCALFDLITTKSTYRYRRRKVPFPELQD